MREHRVPMPGGRYVDPALSADPRIRTVVAHLATLEPAPPVRAHFRAELRAQLVAVAPRLVAEGDPAPAPPAPQRSPAGPRPAPARRQPRTWRSRSALALAGVLTALTAVLVGAVLLSRNALPGDALYPIKRASEDVEMAATSGAVDRGSLALTFAARRLGEVTRLLAAPTDAQSPVAPTASVAALADTTLGSADNDVREAARLLGGAAVQTTSHQPLQRELDWLPRPRAALTALRDRLAPGVVHRGVVRSLDLLDQVSQRAAALIGELDCGCLHTAATDVLGPVPCPACLTTTSPGPASVRPSTGMPSSSTGSAGTPSPSTGASSSLPSSGPTSGPAGPPGVRAGARQGGGSPPGGGASAPGAGIQSGRPTTSPTQGPRPAATAAPSTAPTSAPTSAATVQVPSVTPTSGSSLPIPTPSPSLPAVPVPTSVPQLSTAPRPSAPAQLPVTLPGTLPVTLSLSPPLP